MSLLELPSEIFSILLEELGYWQDRKKFGVNFKYFTNPDIHDIRTLSCTCKTFHKLLSPIVWETFSSKYFNRSCPSKKVIVLKNNNFNQEKGEQCSKYVENGESHIN